MLNFPAFIHRQDKIYDEIRAGHWKARKEGVLEDPVFTRPSRGVGIVMRPHQNIREAFAPWLKKLKKAVPSALVYETRDLHTVIGLVDCVQESEEKVVQILDACYDAVEETIRTWGNRDRSRLAARIDRPTFNQVSAILKTYPTAELVHSMSEMLGSCHRKGAELPLPWGTHMTIARFTGAMSAEAIEKSGLPKVMEDFPASGRENLYVSVDVVQFMLDKRGVHFEVRHRFPIE